MQQQVAAVAPAKQRVKPFGGLTADGELEFGGDGLGSQRHGRETAREQGQQGGRSDREAFTVAGVAA